jgi:hypothetical protein
MDTLAVVDLSALLVQVYWPAWAVEAFEASAWLPLAEALANPTLKPPLALADIDCCACHWLANDAVPLVDLLS